MSPILQLETFVLTRLHIDCAYPENDISAVEIKSTQSTFDYTVGTHKEDPKRRMLRLKVECQECDANQNKVGYRIECELVGLFAFTETTPKGKEEWVIRINGVNMLYGALRGILATTTGVFPKGSFSLPGIMPQEIVDDIEKKRAAANQAAGSTSMPVQSIEESK